MKIIEYDDKYSEEVKDLLVELEEYILNIDKDKLDQLHPNYRELYTKKDLQEVKENNGKCYLALDNNIVIGLIIGIIPEYNEYDYLDYKCPKKGVITELIVSKNNRTKGVGQLLINTMEDYFKNSNCKIVLVDVFAYNSKAISFYNNSNYHSRMQTMIKKI